MNHLTKFFEYVNEGVDYNKETLNELLVPIVDLGVGVEIRDKKVITEGEFAGKEYIDVDFTFGKLKNSDDFGYTSVISDDKIWEFLDELISFKNRLESDKVTFYFNFGKHYGFRCNVCFFVGGEPKSGKLFELEKLYNILRKRSNTGTTEFYYSLSMKLNKEEEQIDISVSSDYTDRKFAFFIRKIPEIKQFNIEKETGYGKWTGDSQSAKITITPK